MIVAISGLIKLKTIDMKRLLLLFIIINITLGMALAQVPNNFRYQAVVRDANGLVVADKVVSVRISVLEGSAVGQTVYSEIFDVATNKFGIVALKIGSGSTLSGVFSQIDWGSNTYYLQIDIDIEGGSNYQFMGTSQILAVPYALQALNVINNDDADADSGNEIQVITKSGNTISLSRDGGSVTDEVNDADSDPVNEIQDLMLTDNVLRITDNVNATPISLSAYQGTNTDEQTLSTNIVGSVVELTIGGGTGGNTVNIELPSDFVSRQNGGTFSGSIFAANLSGTNTGDMSASDVVTAYQSGFPDYFTTADGIKLDGIEAGAKNMSNSDVVTAYQSGFPDYFTSADGIKLDGIEAGAKNMSNSDIVTAYQTGYPNFFSSTDRNKFNLLSLSNNFTVSGGYNVHFNATGNTFLSLPTSGTLANQAYVNSQITNNATPKSLTDGLIFIGNSSNIATQRTLHGDATILNDGTLNLTNIVTSGTYRQVTVDAKGRVTNGQNPTTLSGYGIIDAVSTALTSANLLVGNASNIASSVVLSGDATLSNTGVLSLANTGAVAGTYTKLTVDAKGRVTGGTNPTTLSGYGIVDAMSTSHPANGITSTNISNWNTAYGWGNHAAAGYLTTETDPVYSAWDKSTGISITSSQVSDFQASVTNNTAVLANTAKNTYPAADATKLAGIAANAEVNVNADWNASNGDAQILNKPTTLSGYGISDAMSTSHPANGITSTNISNWNTAYGWGDHAAAGYLTTETDPVYSAWDKSTGISITSSQISDFQASVTNNAAVLANTAKNTYPAADATKLAGIATNAEVNVNADWNASSGDAQILNKPTTLSGYGISDAMSTSHPANGITSTNISNWNTAYGWGDHSTAGYLTDLVSPGPIGSTTPNTGAFSTLSVSGQVNISDVLNLAPMASAPASPNEGDLYVNSTDNNIYCYINGGWRQLNN